MTFWNSLGNLSGNFHGISVSNFFGSFSGSYVGENFSGYSSENSFGNCSENLIWWFITGCHLLLLLKFHEIHSCKLQKNPRIDNGTSEEYLKRFTLSYSDYQRSSQTVLRKNSQIIPKNVWRNFSRIFVKILERNLSFFLFEFPKYSLEELRLIREIFKAFLVKKYLKDSL